MLTMTIDGVEAKGSGSFDVINPATGQVVDQAPTCSAEDLDHAMAAAARAYPAWAANEDTRVSALGALAAAIMAASDELTALLVSETGKPGPVGASEPGICAAWLAYYAGLDVPREKLQDNEQALIEVAYRPLGVVAAITPWNFPLGLAMWKLAPALRAGNTIVLKPSPFTPLATLRLGQVMNEVLPPGVLNVVTGGDDLGAAMTAHRTPRKISFTGSVAAGKSVAVAAASDLKRVTLELGGNDAAILLDDIDVADVASKLVPVALFNTGQACALPKRVYAPAAIYDEVVEAFAAVARSMPVGPPEKPDVALGPLSTAPQFARVSELVAEAIGQGARAATGGHPVDGPGYFFEPTILANPDPTSRVVVEEQFGPALPILPYRDLDEAVAEANNTTFGLCGSAWGTDVARAKAVAERLQCGSTFVNTHAALQFDVPFSGAKWSGLGVENGVPGLLSFTEAQVVHTSRV
jgi:acyl-CoA reductase-like NAD-dependent aldehyde dehydrogenase